MRARDAAALLLALTAAPSQAETTTMQSAFDPTLRSYSKMLGLISNCVPAFPLDVARTKDYAAAFLEISRKAGAKPADIKDEEARRGKEIDITGARPWCLTARAGLRETGAAELFPGE